MDIGVWLRSLGLERYEQAFRDNEIDAQILPRLTADDLKDIGVTIVGHRRKLLEAIAALGPSGEPGQLPPREPQTGPERHSLAPHGQAERRQLTVMFVDLVGSTELSHRLDPEVMGELLRAYQNAVTGEVARFGGHVAKLMGDGVLCYFGWPRAREDAGECAVRAGLAVVAAVSRQAAPDGQPLAARIGIATGLVVVGDLIGEGAAREETVVGETPNLAARLQGLAGPGEVVVGETTRRLIGGAFEFADAGAHELKGFPGITQVWRVVGERDVESRFEAAHAEALTSLVGRDEELNLLLSRWQHAKEGEGQVVLLSGEPGIGKSRLVEALRERVSDERCTRIRYQCSPYHASSALYPAISQLEHAAGFAPNDTPDQKLDKLEALLAVSTPHVAEVAPLIGTLLAIPTGGRYPPLDLPPAQFRERTLNALVEQLLGLSAQGPVLFVMEDAHWIDPTTQDLIGLMIDRIQHAPVLVVITFRPEYVPPWGHHPHVTSLTLSRLGRQESGVIVQHLLGGNPLPAGVLEQIVDKTDGVPLFVEELTKTVIESGLLRERKQGYDLSGPLPPFAIPSTLQDSLMARLDRLAPVREVAQVGAVIGREFAFDLLAAVIQLSDNRLHDALEQLVQSGLVLRRGSSSQPTFAFKHALVQDTAYTTLLRSRRQQLHGRIALVLQERFPDRVAVEPEILARHFQEAGFSDRAAEYWERAGRRAIQRAANLEAINHLQQALAALRSLPQTPERDAKEVDLLTALGIPLIAARGYTAPEVLETYQTARATCERLGEPARLFPVLWGLWTTYRARLDMRTARKIAHELNALARQLKDDSRLLAAHHAEWTTLTYLGDLPGARQHTGVGKALYRPEEHFAHTFIYGGHDPGVCGGATEALVLWMQGYPDQALQEAQAALGLARKLEHPPSIVHALEYLSLVHQFRRERDALMRSREEENRLAREFRLPGYIASCTLLDGWAADDPRPLLAEMRQVLASRLMLVSGMTLPYFQALVAETCLRLDERDEARAILDQGLADIERTGMRQWESELHRLVAEAMLTASENDRDEAESHFRRGLEIARQQQARSLELRVAVPLARLLGQQGRAEEARDLLAPAYNWFVEGLDTPDLREARDLLNALPISTAPV